MPRFVSIMSLLERVQRTFVEACSSLADHV